MLISGRRRSGRPMPFYVWEGKSYSQGFWGSRPQLPLGSAPGQVQMVWSCDEWPSLRVAVRGPERAGNGFCRASGRSIDVALTNGADSNTAIGEVRVFLLAFRSGDSPTGKNRSGFVGSGGVTCLRMLQDKRRWCRYPSRGKWIAIMEQIVRDLLMRLNTVLLRRQ